MTRFYHLETGKPASQQVTEEQNMYGSELSISPRGAAAVILRGHGIEEDSDGFVLDVPAGRIIQTLKTGIYPMAAAFVGEGHIALASKIPKLCCIEVIDAHDGHITQQFGDPETGSRDAVGVSADGKVLFAFSAAEWRYKNALQVRTPHIDVWDTTSGKLIARSPEIEMMKNAGAMLDFSYTDTILPSFELCSRANAILVTWPGRNRASVIYRWK